MDTISPLIKAQKQKASKTPKIIEIVFLENSFTAGTFKLFFSKLFLHVYIMDHRWRATSIQKKLVR